MFLRTRDPLAAVRISGETERGQRPRGSPASGLNVEKRPLSVMKRPITRLRKELRASFLTILMGVDDELIIEEIDTRR